MTIIRKDAWLAAVVLGALTACGGAGSSGGPGGAGEPALTEGAVQGFEGGLVVNGVAFRTSGATFRQDGGAAAALAGEDEIRGRVAEGEVVRLRGRLDDGGRSGEAEAIELHHLLEGEIASRGPGRLVVAGATVSFDDATVVMDRHGDPLASDDLAIGTRVEISGHGDGRGGLRASSIRESADDAGTEREIRAFVVAISGTVVDLSFVPGGAAAVRVDVGGISPSPSLSVGDFVEVRTVGPGDASGVLAATAIHREDRLGARAGDRVEIEGIVTAVDAFGFTVGAQRVEVGAGAELRGGTADDLVDGVAVEVEGFLRADGVLEAREVKLRPAARVEANASAVDAAGATLTALGLVVHVTPSTELRNLSSLAALPAGASVEVRGSPTRDGAGLNATRLELRDVAPADRAFLRGVVTAKTPTTALQILGVAIDTSAAEFRSEGDAAMGAAAFFDAVVPGQTVVKVRWRPHPATPSAPVEEAELEN